jgi:excisionase family DNA binding protein
MMRFTSEAIEPAMALKHEGVSAQKAAQLLGVSYKTFWRKTRSTPIPRTPTNRISISSLDELSHLVKRTGVVGSASILLAANDYVGSTAAANHLGLSVSTLRRMAKSGSIPSQTTDGGHLRFLVSDINTWQTASQFQSMERLGSENCA